MLGSIYQSLCVYFANHYLLEDILCVYTYSIPDCRLYCTLYHYLVDCIQFWAVLCPLSSVSFLITKFGKFPTHYIGLLKLDLWSKVPVAPCGGRNVPQTCVFT